MNEKVNKFLLAGDKFMPEMHFKQPRFTQSACGIFNKSKETIQKLKKTGDTSYIYKTELDKAWFQHDMAYRAYKDLTIRAASDNVLRDKAFNTAKSTKYERYQQGMAPMIYRSFYKKSESGGVNIPLQFNEQLAKELHKPVIRNFIKKQFIRYLKIRFGGGG